MLRLEQEKGAALDCPALSKQGIRAPQVDADVEAGASVLQTGPLRGG